MNAADGTKIAERYRFSAEEREQVLRDALTAAEERERVLRVALDNIREYVKAAPHPRDVTKQDCDLCGIYKFADEALATPAPEQPSAEKVVQEP